MAYGCGGCGGVCNNGCGCGEGSFMLFLILILLMFSCGWGNCGTCAVSD